MKTFNSELVADLKQAVGRSAADRLLPKLEDIAEVLPILSRFAESNVKTERKFAVAEERHWRRARRLIDSLLKEVEQLAAFMRHDEVFDVLERDVNDFTHLLHDLRAKASTLEVTAHAGTVKTRGRSSHARRHPLALAVGKAMTAVGIPLTKGVDGKYAKVLSITYQAAGIAVPVDLFPDIARALEDKRVNLPHAERSPRVRRSSL